MARSTRLRMALMSWIAAVSLFNASGCHTHRILRKETAEVSVTLTDIYYKQVLDNIARFLHAPASMPSFAIINAGTVNVSDTYGGAVTPQYAPTLTTASQGGGALPILSIIFGVTASRNITENWSTSPVTDSDNIRRMRCAFQLVVGAGNEECDNCKQRLQGFFVGGSESFECMLPTGWYYFGCKKDVPKNACYVGHYCDMYVWVMPEGIDGLSRFTITIMDIATGEIHAPSRSVVRRYEGEEKEENLKEVEVTTTEVDKAAIEKGGPMDRERQSSGGMNRGLFFVPR